MEQKKSIFGAIGNVTVEISTRSIINIAAAAILAGAIILLTHSLIKKL